MATRRQVLHQLALGLGVVACRGAVGQPADGARYVGIETSALTGHSRTSFFSDSGQRLASTPLDFRAHGMAQHRDSLIVFPRRPGNKMAVMDTTTLEVKSVVTAPAHRRFCGHGAFSRNGRYVLVTENDLNTLQGFVAVYDVAAGLSRTGSLALPGPGPHEITRAPDSNRFVVALGGLETHPDYGRTPLNLSQFRSQLVGVDLDTGTLDPWGFWQGTEGVSLRHLAYDTRGRLYVGGQVADPQRGTPEHVLWVIENGAVTQIPAGAMLGGYVSSVACHGPRAMVTSKAAHLALTLDGAQPLDITQQIGASAVAGHDQGHALSGFDTLQIAGARHDVLPDHEFDNHGIFLI
ncbi:MAG: DUF1513 domain-containing protein [Pseudomonadota bacterium]